MKKTKRIALLVAVLMLMAVCFAFGASALNYEDYTDMGLVNPDTQAIFSFDLNGGSLKESAYIFDTYKNEFVLTEGKDITGTYVMLPMEEDDQTLGEYIILPAVTAPDGYTHSGWYCYYDEITYAPTTIYRIPKNAVGEVVQFRANYIQDKGRYEAPFYYRVIDGKATIIEVESSVEGKLIIPDTLGGYEVAAIERGAFKSAITEFSVSEENRYFSVDEFGVLFNKDKTELIAYPVANTRKTYKIPESVEVIWNRSFREVLFLRDIELPENLKEVEEYAFYSGVIFFEELYFYDKVEKIGEAAFYSLPFLKKIYVEGMTTEINGERPLGFRELYIKDGVDRDEFADKYIECCLTGNEELLVELENCLEFPEESYYVGTIYCHSGSTAEAYAIAHEMDYELIHFFKGEWTYDYENNIRTRKCIHCDELQVEELEIEEVSGDSFLLVEETVKNGIEGDVEVLKAFDINLKNSDGVHVQPDGTIKVKLPNDWSKNGTYKVYRVNDDGTLTDMNAYREGSHLVFDTDHFSIYVIVFEGVTEEEPETPDTPAEPDTTECDCICHATGFLNRILAVVYRILMKLFGIAPVCECGAAHY